MNYNKLILFILFLPVILFLAVIFLPLILLFGLLALLFGQPVTVKTFRNWNAPAEDPRKEDDVIDVEVIHSGNTGDSDDTADRKKIEQ